MLEHHYQRVELYVYNLRSLQEEIRAEIKNALSMALSSAETDNEIMAVSNSYAWVDHDLVDAFLDSALHDLEVVSVRGIYHHEIPSTLINAFKSCHTLRGKLRSLWQLPIHVAGCDVITKRQGRNYFIFVIDPESDSLLGRS